MHVPSPIRTFALLALLLPLVVIGHGHAQEPVQRERVGDDRTNSVVYIATNVEFIEYDVKADTGKDVEGIFYVPILDKKSRGPQRASPGAVITIVLPKDGKFTCPKELLKQLVDAKAIQIARLEPLTVEE